MNRKSVFSYFMWLVYSIAVCGSLLGAAGYVSRQAGYAETVGFGISGLWLLLCGLIVFLVHKLTGGTGRIKESNKIPMLVAESLIVVLLFAVGIILRVSALGGAGENAAYYEMTKVTEGQVIPPVVHGAVYIYLQFLHMIYLIFGNKFLAGIWAQIILQLVAGLFLYLAVRKMTGVLSALVMLGFFMLGPMMTHQALLLSPEILFLMIYAIILYLCVRCLSGRRGLIGCLMTGVLTAIGCYLDIIGITLFLMIAVGFLLKTRENEHTLAKRSIGAALYLLGGTAGGLLLMAVDAIASSKGFFSVMTAWWSVFCPSAFRLPVVMDDTYIMGEVLILILVLSIGIFSFWCNRRMEGQSLWVLAAILLVLLQSFGMTTAELDGSLNLYFVFTVLAGVSVAEMFTGGKDVFVVSKDVVPETDEDLTIIESPKVKLIENPLPLPKKHVKKILDFDRELENGLDDFDVDVDENDDFDL